MTNAKTVWVTGMGAIAPIGNTVKQVFANACNGTSGIRFLPELKDAGLRCQIAGMVQDFDITRILPDMSVKDARRLDRYEALALVAADEAVRHAGLDLLPEYHRETVAVRVGTGIGGFQTGSESAVAMVEKGARKISPTTVIRLTPNMAVFEISRRFGFHGSGFALSSACSSSADAIASGYDEIMLGRADVVVAGGAEAAVFPLGIAIFDALREALCSEYNENPTAGSRPFDTARCGFVMGEGAAFLILEEAEHAKQRGAQKLATLCGFGQSQDAYHETAPDPLGTFAAHAMKRALASARIGREEVTYINAHGTSTPYNDATEARVIQNVFGKDAEDIWVSSTKSMTGHLLGGAGALEAVLSVLTLETGIIFPTINLDMPDPTCTLRHVRDIAVHEPRLHFVLSNSFGFGGCNTCLVFGT